VHRQQRARCDGFIMGTGDVLWMEAPPCGPLRA
jgi:hypothetical protein